MSREPYPSDVAPRFIVRLPGDLRTRVKAQAARNRRSMNAEIVLMIERGLVSVPSDELENDNSGEKNAES